MNKSDFRFTSLINNCESVKYCFAVYGETKKELKDLYCKEEYLNVSKVIYSINDYTLYIELYSIFDKFIERVENNELKKIVKRLIKDIGGEV